MYYNKKFFREAGLQYPRDGWTWNDFLRDAQKLTVWSKGAYQPTRYGFLAENWMPGWIVWIWQNGGDVLSPNGQTASGYMDSPATIQAVRFFADLEKNHLAPNLSASQAQGEDPFASGLVAMTISGHWDLVPLRASETISMNDVGVVGLPRNKRRVTVIYESGYAITKGCKHPHAAWEYVKFMCGDYVQRMKAKLGIGISAIKSVAESHRNSNPLEPEFLENIKYGVAPWGTRVENYDVIEDIGAEMMDEVLIGHVPPEQALKTATSRANAELESNE
jgi:multiple sugar transport system substrate-binding protein